MNIDDKIKRDNTRIKNLVGEKNDNEVYIIQRLTDGLRAAGYGLYYWGGTNGDLTFGYSTKKGQVIRVQMEWPDDEDAKEILKDLKEAQS